MRNILAEQALNSDMIPLAREYQKPLPDPSSFQCLVELLEVISRS